MARRSLVAACAAVLVLTACDDTAPRDGVASVPTSAAPLVGETAARTAVATCGALRTLGNAIVAEVNASVAGIYDRRPADRLAAILAGIDDVDEIVIDWQADLDGLALPDSVHAADLHARLDRGADAARAELAEQRQLFLDGPAEVVDADVPGTVGTWFTTVEKVMSVVEPEIATLDDPPFEHAFLDEPTCRHVVQQYVVD